MKSILLISLLTLTSCATLEDRRREAFYNSSPAGFTEVITAKKLSKLKPIQILRILKKSCCDAVMIEPSAVTDWTEDDIAAIKPMLGDQSFVAPVASTSGTYSCRGPTYMSTMDREAQHLILAYKEKTYPLAQCSTLDLKLKTKD